MTQDPYGQPPGPGYVVRGEVVPDDEANANSPTVPVTHFQKVASALRGDRTDPAAVASDEGPGPGPDQASSQDVGAVRSPDAGNLDYWDDEGETGPDGPAAEADPTMTQPDLYGTTTRGETDPADPAGPAGSAETSEASEALLRSLRPWGSMPVLRRRRACGRVSPIAGCVTSAT